MGLLRSRLWVVATPLGNPDDLSPRAREILARVAYILAEDTRRAQALCRRCGIPERPFLSFYDHTEEERLPQVLDLLRKGCELALISDAGTPLISDPGYRLVRACHAVKIPVSPVPGPSAPMAALSIAGIPPIPSTFLGFLPRERSAIHALFSAFAMVPGSLVFFERSDRVGKSLACAYEVLGSRDVALCRELTKVHEEVLRFRLEATLELPPLLGELTVVLGPGTSQEKTAVACVRELFAEERIKEHTSTRSLVKAVQKKVIGWHSKELYEELERSKHDTDSE